MKRTFTLSFVLAMCVAFAHAGDGLEDASLLTGCQKLNAGVILSENAGGIGLAWKGVKNAIELRMRSSRVFASEPDAALNSLLVHISVAGDAFSILVNLSRWLPDTGFGHGGMVTVWQSGLIGTHGGDRQHVLGAVEQEIDAFLVAYLRANEAHCSVEDRKK